VLPARPHKARQNMILKQRQDRELARKQYQEPTRFKPEQRKALAIQQARESIRARRQATGAAVRSVQSYNPTYQEQIITTAEPILKPTVQVVQTAPKLNRNKIKLSVGILSIIGMMGLVYHLGWRRRP